VCWRSDGQEPRSGAVPRVENQSSPRLLPMATTAGLLGDQEGKGGGNNPFIQRESRGSRVWEGWCTGEEEEGWRTCL
jgi:hypothetical protein